MFTQVVISNVVKHLSAQNLDLSLCSRGQVHYILIVK